MTTTLDITGLDPAALDTLLHRAANGAKLADFRNLDDALVQVDAGKVWWMDQWERADELVALSLLRRENRGPATLGHCDYYLA